MEVVDVSIFKPATFRAFFSSMFLSDGGQNQGSQSQCTSFIFFYIYLYPQCFSQTESRTRDPKVNVRLSFSSFFLFLAISSNFFSQTGSRIKDPKVNRRDVGLSSFSSFFYLTSYPTNPAGGGFMNKAKGMLHDLKDGGGSRKSSEGYTRPGNEGDY